MIRNVFAKLKTKRKKLTLFSSLLILSTLMYFKRSQTILLTKSLFIKFKLWFSMIWNIFKTVYPTFSLTRVRLVMCCIIDA